MLEGKGEAALDACPECGRQASPEQAFCVSCGSRLPQPRASEIHNPFERIKVRSLIIWAVVTFAITMTLFTVVAAIFELDTADPANLTFALDIWLYGALAAWLAWQFWRRRVRMAKLIGSLSEGYDWLPTVGILVTTVVFSIGSLILVLALVSFLSTDRVENFVGRDPLGESATSAAPLVFLFALAGVPADRRSDYRGASV